MSDEQLPAVVQDFGPRLPDVKVVKPIVVGNWARMLPAKNNQGRTHSWKVYLRLYNGENSSGYIKKVQFKLHDSYVDHTRIREVPPYEVEETGWGEFGIAIKIYFADPAERPVTISHFLRLFIANKVGYGVIETYDELIFSEPSTRMYGLLMNARPLSPNISNNFETDFEQKKKETLELISSAKRTIEMEIEELRRRLDITKANLAKQKSEKNIIS